MCSTNGKKQFYESALFQSFGKEYEVLFGRSIGGGCINNGVKLETDKGNFFLKWNDDAEEDLFDKELLGLNLLHKANCLLIPQGLGRGKIGQKNFLILEYIEKAAPSADFWEDFGRKLARQHKITSPQYGLDHNNHIGKLLQKNDPKDDWIEFFIENRLEVQLGLALYNHQIDDSFARKFRNLYAQLPGIIPDEPASFLHGDLWNGNFMVGPNGKACIFDPAVYYGHREIELAFTRLFGGFDLRFYESYNDEFPLAPGFEKRIDIYNLYPLLVHVNLFGSSYLAGVEQTMHRFK